MSLGRTGQRHLRWAAALGLSAFCAGTAVRADPVDPQRVAAAQALFNRGVAALDAKNYAVACPLLAEAVSLEPDAVGARFVLAECYEAQGKLASAWSTYLSAQAQAEKSGRADRSKDAQKKAAALLPKLATLTLVVPDAVRALPGLTIKRDGIDVGAAQWGTPLPVDKGSHSVVVTASGRAVSEGQVQVAQDGAPVSFEVAAPPPAAAAAGSGSATAGPAPSAPPTAGSAAPLPSGAPAASMSPVRIAGFAVGAAGIAALAGGVVAGVLALDQKGASNGCTFDTTLGKDVCSGQAAVDARNSAVGMANVSTVLFIAGGAAASVGLALVVLGGSANGKAPQKGANSSEPARAMLKIGPTGMSLVGRF